MSQIIMYAKVIPAVRLPKSFGGYDYAIPEQYRAHVKRGSWVVVPWRNKPTDALVVEVTDTPSIDASKVKDMIGFGDTEVLGEDLIAILDRAAKHWFSSPTSIVKAFLPVTPKTKIIREIEDDAKVQRCKGAKVSLVDGLVIYRSPEEKLSGILELVRKAEKAGSVLIITPHSDEIDPLFKHLQTPDSGLRTPIVPLHGGMSGPAQRRAWKKILSEPKSIVVGTRLAAFAPINSPALFLIVESDSADLRQYDQNPRYDARDVCRWRADMAGASMVMLSQAPRLEEFAGGLKLPKESPTGEAILVDIAGNPRGAEHPLSPVVMQRAEEALLTEKKVLLYHNRLGAAGALFCRDCGRVFRCPACKIAATVLRHTLKCGRCGLEGPIPLKCPDCDSANLGEAGMGTASMVPALSRAFPGRKVQAYDSAQTVEERQATLADADIVIGTRLLLHEVSEIGPSDCWGCVAATDLDEALSHPGFRVAEDAWRTVQTLRNIAGSSGADLMLQTVDPDNLKIRRLLQSFNEFMTAEAENRRLVGYPPSGDLITVTIKADSESLAESAAAEFRQQAERLVTDATFAGPLRHSRPYRDGKWRRVVAIKTPAVSDMLTDLLRSLPEEYIIDRNPESVG